MTINVKVMKESAYETLVHNSKKAYEKILSNPYDSSWLTEFVGEEPFEEKPYPIEDFELLYDDNYEKVRFQNGIILYNALNEKLPSYILYDLHFWAWINFEKAYRQAQRAVELKSLSIFQNFWISGKQNRRSIMRGVMSREFVKVKISIDERLDDKYELTKYLFTNGSLFENFMYRNIGDLRNVTLPVIRIEKEVYEATHRAIDRDDSSALLKEASRIGSVMLIDEIPEDDIEAKLRKKATNIFAKYY